MVNPEAAAARDAAQKALIEAEASGVQSAIDAANVLKEKADTMIWDYTTPILMLVFLGVISIFFAFMLKRADKKQKYGLELPSGEKPE